MFDFLRDVVLEAQGIDTVKAKNEREEKREQKKLSRFIFTKGAKWTIVILGSLYIPLSIMNVIGIISEAHYFSADTVLQTALNILLLLICIGVCVSLLIGKKLVKYLR